MIAHGRSLQVVRFFRFMRLFGATMFSVIRVGHDSIRAVVAWEDDCELGIPDPEDAQEVRWTWDAASETDDALTVGEYAYEAGWISLDRIRVDQEELRNGLGWNPERVTNAVDTLLRLRAQMIDDGHPTDSFFLHS